MLFAATGSCDPALADDATPSTPPAPSTSQLAPSANPAINLINLLVKRGVISKAEAAALIKQANDDAARTQATAAEIAASASAAKAAADKAVAAQAAANEAQAEATQAQTKATEAKTTADFAQATATTANKPQHQDAVRVTYVPEVVKKQLRDEIKQQVMAQAQAENWAAPNQIPEWTKRLHPYGDVRFRYEGDIFPSGNDNTGAFPNFNAINTGSPFDIGLGSSPLPLEPERNVDQDRSRFRLRARAGVAADLPDGFSADLRIGTGENDQPVSENQSLGAANSAQGGNFSKYQVWLDRAYIKYDPMKGRANDTSVTVGRFDNPFFSTNLIWWEDPLAFDGAVVQDHYKWRRNVTGFFTAGAFPIFNTDFNFASNEPAKFTSNDKWLFAAQTGADWKINKNDSAKVGIAYYDFYNVEGRVSSPCNVVNSSTICDSDDSRPSFAQNGNTYMPLRNIIANASNNFGGINQFQYFGLATPFHELALTGRYDYDHFNPFHIRFDTEFVDNLAFDRTAITQKACGPSYASSYRSAYCGTATGEYMGGNIGYLGRVTVGKMDLVKRWDWNVSFGYRYVESDSVVDAFNDPDFGMGGTNLQGFTFIGNVALARGVTADLRLFSADSIAGPTYAVDVIQMDVSVRF